MRVLVVEDAEDVADAVAVSFARTGDAVDRAGTLELALAFLESQSYDLVVLDIELPDGEGTVALRRLRARRSPSLVMMLTAQSDIDARVLALDAGADDYMTKPFDLRELQARVRSLVRRAQGQVSPEVVAGRLSFDPARHVARIGDEPLALTRRELALLEIMLSHRGWVISKDRIFDKMFAFSEEDVGVNAVEIYMTRLRRKLEGSGVTIRTLRGLGYQMVCDE